MSLYDTTDRMRLNKNEPERSVSYFRLCDWYRFLII